MVRSTIKTGCLIALAAIGLMAVTAGGAIWGFNVYLKHLTDGPDPTTIASASLQGLREQNRLSAFSARYVAVVTSSQSRLGLGAEKTLIMPGTVRYEVDLGKLQQNDVRWNAASKTLSIKLPPIEVVGPQVDLTHVREYGGSGILTALTDTGAKLDAANRAAGQQELLRQAEEPTPMKLARDATRRAVEHSFAMPLKAAGINASVEAHFADEQPDNDDWDRSRSLQEIFGNSH